MKDWAGVISEGRGLDGDGKVVVSKRKGKEGIDLSGEWEFEGSMNV